MKSVSTQSTLQYMSNSFFPGKIGVYAPGTSQDYPVVNSRGFSYRKCAAEMGLPPQAVKKRDAHSITVCVPGPGALAPAHG